MEVVEPVVVSLTQAILYNHCRVILSTLSQLLLLTQQAVLKANPSVSLQVICTCNMEHSLIMESYGEKVHHSMCLFFPRSQTCYIKPVHI